MTVPAAGGDYMSEQQSQIFCQETATDEGGNASGAGATGGTFPTTTWANISQRNKRYRGFNF